MMTLTSRKGHGVESLILLTIANKEEDKKAQRNAQCGVSSQDGWRGDKRLYEQPKNINWYK